MRSTGPALTLVAVGAVAAGVTTANVVLTAGPEPSAVQQAPGAPADFAVPPAGVPSGDSGTDGSSGGSGGSGSDGGGYR